MTTPGPTCIANSGADGEREVPFYDCPCAECTRMEWHVNLELNRRRDVGPLKRFRHESFPEFWDADGKPITREETPSGAPSDV